MKATRINHEQQKHLEDVAKTERKIAQHMSDHLAKVQDNVITLPDGTRISVYGINQHIKLFGFTMSPLTKAAPKLLRACKGMIEDLNEYRLTDERHFTLERASMWVEDLEKIVSEAEENQPPAPPAER